MRIGLELLLRWWRGCCCCCCRQRCQPCPQRQEGEATILERLPQDLRAHVLELSGGEAWHRGVRSANRALRRLCETKEMRDALMTESVREFKRGLRDALRKRAKGEFKRGVDLSYGTNGAVQDEQAGKALVMRAAAAGLRPAIAECFYEGWGTSEDHDKAAALWQAELDDSTSETEASRGACCWSAYWLAFCYRYGHGVEIDYARALELYSHATETDENGVAMWILYEVYRHGHLGQAVDHAHAVSWLKRSANSGYYHACYLLGEVLERGELGLDVDLKEALRYYEKAGEQGAEEGVEQWRDRERTAAIARVRAAIAEQSRDRYPSPSRRSRHPDDRYPSPLSSFSPSPPSLPLLQQENGIGSADWYGVSPSRWEE